MIKFYEHPSPHLLEIALYPEEIVTPVERITVVMREREQHREELKEKVAARD